MRQIAEPCQGLDGRYSSCTRAGGVEEDGDVGHEQAELPLDRGALVLTRAPNVREEEVPRVPLVEVEVGLEARARQPNGRHTRRLDKRAKDEEPAERKGTGNRAEKAERDVPRIEDKARSKIVVHHIQQSLGKHA